jgi:membrane-bound lytic murein transglycosylase B
MSPGLKPLIAAAAVTMVVAAGCVGTAPGGAAARAVSAEQIAAGLVANDAALRAAIDAWRADEDPPSADPPAEVMDASRYLQKTIRTLVRKRSLARNVRDRLPSRLEGQLQSLIVAQRDLVKLSNGWPPHEVETGKPEPLANLWSYYDEAHDRHGIGQPYLAAINLVESKFGRVKNDSVAGAQGPMQFIPSTWEIYGNGGNIQDPHDAILAAANLLRDNGAPGDYPRALRAYNDSSLYVDAVTRYARQIKRDPYALYFFYCFGP